MYFNDVHILYYVAVAIIGLFVGEFVNWMNQRLPEYKNVFSKEFITEHKINFKPNYILMLLTSFILHFELSKTGKPLNWSLILAFLISGIN